MGRERETPALTVMRSLPWAAGLCLLGLLKEGVERDPENCLSAGRRISIFSLTTFFHCLRDISGPFYFLVQAEEHNFCCQKSPQLDKKKTVGCEGTA